MKEIVREIVAISENIKSSAFYVHAVSPDHIMPALLVALGTDRGQTGMSPDYSSASAH